MENKRDLYNVGKIVGTHGVKGEVKVASITDFPENRYKVKNILYLNDLEHPVEIQSVRQHKGMYLLKFTSIPDLTEAEKLRGTILKGTREKDELASNEFYYSDIIGLTVIDKNLGKLGTIKEILSPGANDVWVVKAPKTKDILIPYIPSVVLNVDLENKTVETDLPEGLVD